MNSRYGVWPAIGLAPGLLDVQTYFGENIVNRFPKGYISSFHFDNKISYKTEYNSTRKNLLKNKFRGQYMEQNRPRLTIVFNNTDGKQEDAAYGEDDPFIYPLTQGLQPEMHGYIPIYKDRHGVEIWQVPKRVKYTFSAILELDTFSDQESALVIVENILKLQYGAMLEKFKAGYILPNDLINLIYRAKYFDQITRIKSDKDGDDDEKNEALFLLGDEFERELDGFSYGGIRGFSRNGKRDDKFFKFYQIYEKMYFQLTDYPEKTDGERLGSIYSKFSVTFNGFFEFFKPNAYILKLPEVINGHVLTDVLESTGNINYFRDYNPVGYMKYYTKEEILPKEIQDLINQEGYSIIYTDTDLSMESPRDTIDIIDWMGTSPKKECKKYAALIATMEKEEFVKELRVFMYNVSTNYRVADKDIKFDGEILHINNLNQYSQYCIFVLAKLESLENKLKRMIKTVNEKTEVEQNGISRNNWK